MTLIPAIPPCCALVLDDLCRAVVAEADTDLEPDQIDEATAEATARAALNRWRFHCREHRQAWHRRRTAS